MHRIFYIMGKSASGKDKLYRNLLSHFSVNEPLLKPLVLYTTRPMRTGEVNGEDYWFVDRASFLKMKEAGNVIEERTYDTIHGPWTYFTSSAGIDLAKYSYLGIGTLESFTKLVGYFGRDRVVDLYVEVEDGLRLDRAVRRERKEQDPKYLELCRRFLSDAQDFSEDNLKKAGIEKRFFNNRAFEDCLSEMKRYIELYKEQ